MSYEHLRRSTRIPKELAVLLTGSDMEGKGFSEMTKTVLLSRHGAGIISSYKLSAEQEIILRYLDTNKEALVRVVGRIGSEGEIYTYGVAFVDPSTIDFWGVDFAPVSESEKRARRVVLECGNCKKRETVEHSDVESDVFIINEGIVRYCKQCGDSTLWRRSSEIPSTVPDEQPALVGAGRESVAASSTRVGNPGTDQVAGSPSSIPPAQTPSAYAPTSDRKPAVPLDNRRKHQRTKVSYKACIRRSGFPDDVVTCEDMSKGGICIRSRKKYFERTVIEVAVPYSYGANVIFVPAEIAWVVEVTPDKLYKCGVAYRRASKPA